MCVDSWAVRVWLEDLPGYYSWHWVLTRIAGYNKTNFAITCKARFLYSKFCKESKFTPPLIWLWQRMCLMWHWQRMCLMWHWQRMCLWLCLDYTYPPMVEGRAVSWLLSTLSVVRLSRLPTTTEQGFKIPYPPLIFSNFITSMMKFYLLNRILYVHLIKYLNGNLWHILMI